MKYQIANNIAVIIGLIMVGFFTYGNSMKNDFIFDDKALVVNNAFIKSCNNVDKIFVVDLHYFGSTRLAQDKKINYYRPIIALSFMLDYFLWGLESFGFHLTNILFHICSAILIFFLAQALVHEKRIGVIASFLFLVHPINTEAITYISGRGEPLSLFFSLLSILFFIRHVRKYKNIFSFSNLLSCMFFGLALFTRENNIAFIFILVGYLYVWRETKTNYTRFFNLLPHILILVLFVIFRVGVLGVSAPLGLIEDPVSVRLMTLPKVILEYLSLFLFPINLHMCRTLTSVKTIFSPFFLFPAAIVLAIFIFIARSSKTDKFLQFSALWAVISFLPFSSIISPLTTYIAEHWFYIPFVGVSFIIARYIAGWLDRFKRYKFFIIGVLVAILVIYAAITIKQNTNWKNELTFYSRTIELEKRDYRLLLNLAANKLKEKQYDEAIKLIKSVFDIIPKDAMNTELGRYHLGIAYKTLGDVYRAKGDPKKGLEYYRKAIDVNPKYSDVYNELGSYYFDQGDEKSAVSAYEKSIEFAPNTWQPYANLGRYYLEKGDLDKAKYYWEKVLVFNPGFKDAIEALNGIEKKKR